MNKIYSQKDLLHRFFYEKEAGLLYHKNPVRSWRKGKQVGTLSSHGYLVVNMDKKTYYLHRIIWQMHFGQIAAKKND